VRLASLPSTRNRQEIELGLKGVEARVAAALQWLQWELSMRQLRWEHRAVSGMDSPA
jgi:hypothetical protein